MRIVMLRPDCMFAQNDLRLRNLYMLKDHFSPCPGPSCSKRLYLNEFVSGQMLTVLVFVCVEVLRPSQPNGVMLSVVSLPNHMFTG